uniref:Uncharacterized protein n=1 Tax=Nelumbo nucifera TaxID=4432 RepID=A0A822XEG8_NELNU|nr:TPA_asm: hypothetical protein HUJ06_020183 [Nelumbo nucifera]
MAGVAEAPNRSARPLPPPQARGPPPPARPRFEPVDREKVRPLASYHYFFLSFVNLVSKLESLDYSSVFLPFFFDRYHTCHSVLSRFGRPH